MMYDLLLFTWVVYKDLGSVRFHKRINAFRPFVGERILLGGQHFHVHSVTIRTGGDILEVEVRKHPDVDIHWL